MALSYNALTELLTMLEYDEAAAKLTNAQLAHILIEHVWAELPLDSAASAFISEVAHRLDPNVSGGDDWVDYLVAHAPDPEPDDDTPEPPEDWDDEAGPYYDTPGGY